MVRCALALLLTFGAATNLLTSAQVETASDIRPDAIIVPKHGDQRQRDYILARVRFIAEKTLALKDVKASALGAASLADLLWQDDQTFARRLFNEALALTEVSEDEAPSSPLPLLRRRVITLIAKRDAGWSRRLIGVASPAGTQGAKSVWQSETNVAVASSLVKDDPQAAAEFAAHSLGGGV